MRLVAVFGWLLFAISALFVVVAFGELLADRQGDVRPEINLGIGAFFLVLGYFGFRLATGKPPGSQPAPSPDLQMLALAQRLNGRLTLAEVVLHAKLPVSEARAVLKGLVQNGLAELHVTDGGEEVYAFRGLIPEDKRSAKDPFA